MNAKSVVSRPLRKAPLSRAVLSALLASLAATPAAWASSVTTPYNFQPNTPAVASQVNANFGAFETAVDDNAADIAALQQQIATQAATIQTLMDELNTLQSNTVLALNGYLGLATVDGYDTAVFEAVNVQIVNGLGETNQVNGLGNLTVGYNELAAGAEQVPICSNGSYALQTDCEAAGQTWAANQRIGSHNLIVGRANAYTQYGGMVIGYANSINREYAVVSGGLFNLASGQFASVTGGEKNIASAKGASVTGGYNSRASGLVSSVTGGYVNRASGDYASVSGGQGNVASGDDASVSGGRDNEASATGSSVSGGHNNLASGLRSSVSGGETNTASGDYASTSGGQDNNAIGPKSSVNGGFNNVAGSTANPLAPYASVSGGSFNVASGNFSSVSGGYGNNASGEYSSVSGAYDTNVTGMYDWAAGSLFQDN